MSSVPPHSSRASSFETAVDIVLESIKNDHNDAFDGFSQLLRNMTLSRQLFPQLIKFLYIKRHVDQNVSPSGSVDEVWHALLLMPKFYATICLLIDGKKSHELTMGVLIDHNPLGGVDEASRRIRYTRTLRLLKECFPSHEIDQVAWPELEPIPRAKPGSVQSAPETKAQADAIHKPALKKQRVIKAEVAPSTEKVRFCVEFWNKDPWERMPFECDPRTKMHKIMTAACGNVGVMVDMARFLWSGVRLNGEEILGDLGIPAQGGVITMILGMRGC